MYNHDEQAIIAHCTPKGSGAIALLRISGANSFTVAEKISLLASGKLITALPSHTIHYGWVIDSAASKIDQVLFLLMRAPHTFTGQDTVEITCHNNPFIIEAIIAHAVHAGARLAHEGEFSKRAVLNEKIDLLQAEAINELIHANTQQTLKQSMAQLQGSFSQWIAQLEKDLFKALAFCQASFEFLDEEMSFAPQIHAIIEETRATIRQLQATYNQQQQIRDGIRIAIIGSVNAGKSSLFNALLKRDRAIVTPIAGTTRDVIEAGMYQNGNYWSLIDTAGLRQTDDSIEQEGIRRSFDQAQQADIILLAFDQSRELSAQEHTVYQELIDLYHAKIIGVFTKNDLAKQLSFTLPDSMECIAASSTDQDSIALIQHTIESRIGQLFTAIESPFLVNKRHHTLLVSLEQKLADVSALLTQKNVAYELVCHHLYDALESTTELTGKSISEQAMDAVFREFCVGK